MLHYNVLEFKHNFDSEYLGQPLINLLDKTFYIPNQFVYDVFEVTSEYIARPDLISLDAYGDDMFADIICKVNGISNPFELNEGMKLILPSPENVLDFARQPSYLDNDENYGSSNRVTNTKTKQSKRQPNEAIIGDGRFKIDKTSKIIIY